MSRKKPYDNRGMQCFYGTAESTLQILDQIRAQSDAALAEQNSPTDPQRAALVEEVLDLAFGKHRYEWRRPSDTENVLIIACLRMERRITCKNCARHGKCTPQQTGYCVSKNRLFFRPVGELFKETFQKVTAIISAYEQLKSDEEKADSTNETDESCQN